MADFFSFLIKIIEKLGYFGILISTSLEYGCFPISSEILLPFIGCITFSGEKNLIISIIISVIGAVIGCSFCFFAGRFGRKSIERICRKNKAVKLSINKADEMFKKYGNISVFLFRLMPIARTYISFPAGMSSMSYKRFIILSLLGALIWNSVLISAGFILGSHWREFTVFLYENKAISNTVIFTVIFIILFKLFRKKQALKHQK